jgi:hypothetical protein
VIRKVLTLGKYSAKPYEFTRLSEVNIDAYIKRMEGMLEQIFSPLEISFKDIYFSQYKKIEQALEESPKDELGVQFKKRKGLETWME